MTENSFSLEDNDSSNPIKEKMDDIGAIHKLSLRGKNLTSLEFLSKFMRENPNIANIDLGENPLSDIEM